MTIDDLQLSYCLTEDLKAIAECHKQAFPTSFSTKLGKRYLVKNYEWYLSSPKTILIKASIGSKVVGFCGGLLIDANSEMGSTSSVMQYTFRQAVMGIIFHPWLLFNKEVSNNLRLIVRNIRRKINPSANMQLRKAQTDSNKKDSQVSSLGLVVIGNDPTYRGKGIGTALLKRFEAEAIRMNAKQMHLSVHRDNAVAIKSYTRNGWSISKEMGDNFEMIKALS